MSSPWNQQENWSAASPGSHGGAVLYNPGATGTDDEWDRLRSSPDFDMEEMQGVSLPAAFPSGPAGFPAVAAPPESPPAFAAVAQPVCPSPVPTAAPAPACAPTPLAERWPETADVAHLASDLYVEAQGEGLWRAVEIEEEGPTEEDDHLLPDFRRFLPQDDRAEDEGSASWAFLPDTMLQGGDGGRDLLTEALQAGARAGLLDAGDRLESTEPQSDSAPIMPNAPGELPDLLDAALTAGKRAGLMGP